MTPALSFVIPLYNSAETIAPLVHEIERLTVPGGHEIVLVNDGSSDSTANVCRDLVGNSRIPITYVEHARNFGEHNAVLTGWRHAHGTHIVNLDDDGQNPPAEAVRLWQHAKDRSLDVVYGQYDVKRHSSFRNAGSWLTNRMTDWALDKPKGFYLSSFRCVSGAIARHVIGYAGPYPYIDGLLLQVTQRIDSIEVRHDERRAGTSGYTLRRLIRLWLSAWLNFSGTAVAGGDVPRVLQRYRGSGGLRGGARALDAGVGARLWVGMGDGHGARVFRDPTGDARPHRRIHRPDVPHREPAPPVGRARCRAQCRRPAELTLHRHEPRVASLLTL